jgi:hypothetical protein
MACVEPSTLLHLRLVQSPRRGVDVVAIGSRLGHDPWNVAGRSLHRTGGRTNSRGAANELRFRWLLYVLRYRRIYLRIELSKLGGVGAVRRRTPRFVCAQRRSRIRRH